MKFKGIEGEWVLITDPSQVKSGDYVCYTIRENDFTIGLTPADSRTVSVMVNGFVVVYSPDGILTCPNFMTNNDIYNRKVFVPSKVEPTLTTLQVQKQQIVATTKKAFDIATKLINTNLEGLGNDGKERSDMTINEASISKIEGLLNFLKNELELYKSNMQSAERVDRFIKQHNKE